jgi:predicted transcriptional regulator of viral defense system
MLKVDALYSKLYAKEVLTFDDIVAVTNALFQTRFSRAYIFNKYVRKLLNSKRLQRVRQGLYVISSPSTPPADKLLIGSNIRTMYFLGFHTALEFYGCAYSAYHEVYVCVRSRHRFDAFTFNHITYRPVFVSNIQDGVDVKHYKAHNLRVSSKERTFIDCLDKIPYAGGWEECLKSLQGLGGVNFDNIPLLLPAYPSQVLTRKVGYVLDLLQAHSVFYQHVPSSVLQCLAQRVKGSPQYLIRGKPGPLHPRWRLYIPFGFEDYLKGV